MAFLCEVFAPRQEENMENLVKMLEFYSLLIEYDKSHKTYSVYTDEPDLDD